MACSTCGKAKGIIVGGKVNIGGNTVPTSTRRIVQGTAPSQFGFPKVRISFSKNR